MKKILLLLGIVIATPLIALLCFFIYGAFLWILGYQLGLPPWELAEKLVNEGRPPEDCYLYRTLDLGPRPTTVQQQALCIYEYAAKSKDPSVCALLLPSEYGMACLSTVGGNIFSGNHCTGTYGKNEVFCSSYSEGGELTINNPQIENCSMYTRNDVRDWCYKARTSLLKDVHDCDQITNKIEHDGCEQEYAFKQKDPALCNLVKDINRQKYCEIRISTWLKYPELRSSFYFGEQSAKTGSRTSI